MFTKMHVRTSVLSIALSAGAFWPMLCHAGSPGGSGGGGVFECTVETPYKTGLPTEYSFTTRSGTIAYKHLETELIDFWEGQTNRKNPLTIIPSPQPVDVQYSKALEKLRQISPDLATRVLQEHEYMKTHTFNMKPGDPFYREIMLPSDLRNKYRKPGCEAKGMMLFDSETMDLNIDDSLAEELKDNTNIAGSQMHEDLYKALREVFDQTDSLMTRRVNAFLFSTSAVPRMSESDVQPVQGAQEYYKCENKDFTLFLSGGKNQSENDRYFYTAVFVRFGGETLNRFITHKISAYAVTKNTLGMIDQSELPGGWHIGNLVSDSTISWFHHVISLDDIIPELTVAWAQQKYQFEIGKGGWFGSSTNFVEAIDLPDYEMAASERKISGSRVACKPIPL